MPTPLLAPAIAFFVELEADNSTEFWGRHRHRYAAEVRAPFADLCDRLGSWGPWRVYRPHANRRFRPDTPPLKTFVGAVAERPDGVGAFLQVSRRGLLVASGIPMPAADQLARLRAAIADDAIGPTLLTAVGEAEAAGATVHGGRWEPLRRVPRGFPADHPRGALLRWKGVEANRRIADPPWTSLDEAAPAVAQLLDAPTPLHRWLAAHVGPSDLTPEERFAPRGSRST